MDTRNKWSKTQKKKGKMVKNTKKIYPPATLKAKCTRKLKMDVTRLKTPINLHQNKQPHTKIAELG